MPKTNSLLWIALLAPLLLSAQDKPRVFVSTGEPRQITDSSGGSKTGVVEIQAIFKQRCPEVTVTTEKAKADFSVAIDAGSKQADRIAVFDKSGDLIFTGSTRFLRNAVKDACEAIKKAMTARK